MARNQSYDELGGYAPGMGGPLAGNLDYTGGYGRFPATLGVLQPTNPITPQDGGQSTAPPAVQAPPPVAADMSANAAPQSRDFGDGFVNVGAMLAANPGGIGPGSGYQAAPSGGFYGAGAKGLDTSLDAMYGRTAQAPPPAAVAAAPPPSQLAQQNGVTAGTSGAQQAGGAAAPPAPAPAAPPNNMLPPKGGPGSVGPTTAPKPPSNLPVGGGSSDTDGNMPARGPRGLRTQMPTNFNRTLGGF